MKNGKQEDYRSSSSAHEDFGIIDQARALYTRYAGYAAQERAQSHKTNTRPAWQRTLNIIGLSLVAIAVLVLASGTFKWPDAPIRQTPGGFVGKTGLVHTREDYELFKLWEKSLLVTFPLAFIVNIIAATVARRKGKKESLKT